MSSYLLINICVIAIPLLFSFERKVQFYRKFPSLLISIASVGTVYVMWDIVATARGDWAFSPEHVIGIDVYGLPIEELLFFITVPYACLFIYEVVRAYMPEKKLGIPTVVFMVPVVAGIVVGFIAQGQPYTQTVSLFTAAFFILSLLIYPDLLRSSQFWIFIAITYVPFFVVNYMLTSIPIVTYGPEAFSGIRITTIPLEDFFYSFSMLGFHVLIFRFLLNRWQSHLQ